MSVLIIDDAGRAAIEVALKRARENAIPWEELRKAGGTYNKAIVSLADRNPEFCRPESEHVMLGTYRVAVSFEHQPSGLYRHLSVSSHRPGRVPGREVVKMVVEEFGFRNFPVRRDEGQVWLEEFQSGHHAVNVIELVKDA